MAAIQKAKLPECAQQVIQNIQPKERDAFLIFLSGNLGSGKTAFMQAFARELGVPGTIQSPTFVLMKKYAIGNRADTGAAGIGKTTQKTFVKIKAAPVSAPAFSTLIHIDAYRLETAAEFGALKPEEFLNDASSIVCIEWAENIRDALPQPDMMLKFSSDGMEEGERDITIFSR